METENYQNKEDIHGVSIPLWIIILGLLGFVDFVMSHYYAFKYLLQ